MFRLVTRLDNTTFILNLNKVAKVLPAKDHVVAIMDSGIGHERLKGTVEEFWSLV